jgi:diguanylate cyclase (GGDEF)-like protein
MKPALWKCLSNTSCAVVLGAVALAAGVWLIALERIGHEQEQAEREAYTQISNLALAFEQDVVRTLQSISQVIHTVELEHRTGRMPRDIREVLSRASIDAGLFTGMAVLDQQGTVIHSHIDRVGRNLSDRDYFLFHRDNASSRLYVGQAMVGRISGQPTITVSQRIDKPDGTFGGVIVAGFAPSYFTDFYRKLDVGRSGMIALAGLDGAIRARRVGSATSSGGSLVGTKLLAHAARAPEGQIVGGGRLDGIVKFTSFRRLEQYPLFVFVGLSVDEALAAFRARKQNYLLAASSATVLLGVFAAMLIAALLQQRRAMKALELANVVVRNGRSVLFQCTPQQTWPIQFVSSNVSIWGHDAKTLSKANAPFSSLVHSGDLPRLVDLVERTVRAKLKFFDAEFRILDSNRRSRWVDGRCYIEYDADGKVVHYQGIATDIDDRKAAEAQLKRRAHYDGLTELPNRALCFERLSQAIEQAQRGRWYVAVLFVDLDRFKAVNETFGHTVGDAVLRAAGTRLTESVRSGDTVARVGGDEFVVVLPGLPDPQTAAVISRKIIAAISTPLCIEDNEVFGGASIGIAICATDGQDAETLMRNAAAAVGRAKQVGRNNFQFYTSEMNVRAQDRLLLEGDLHRALERKEFVLHYQPKASLASGTITGFEALIRWQRHGVGLIAPARFIPLLEDSGKIVQVGEWVVRAACRQLQEWRNAGLAVVPVAVNVSAKQFNRGLYEVIDGALREHEIDPSMLELEITETDAMSDPGRVIEVLQKLRDIGVKVSIDDFGTGYSSLGYLKRFPISQLKLDRAFVHGLPDDADDTSITKAVISMAHSLGLQVVAEGVENEAQRNFLSAHGCDQMQGYLLSPAVPAADCHRFLALFKNVANYTS